MAQFHPPVRPDLLSERLRDAESEVWESFRQLDNSWHVFYSARENSESGYDREIDFILIRLNQIFYCEVKGGVVEVDQRFGPGVTWKHSKRSGEPIKKRVDPQQLLNAKAALNATIRKVVGATPRELGFLEHNYYIFPHTSRDVTGGVDFDRGAFHYVFAEDMMLLPYRLRQIVDAKTSVYVHPDKIGALIAALNGMVIKSGDWPDLSAEVSPTRTAMHDLSPRRSLASQAGSAVKRALSWRWHYAALGLAGLYLLSTMLQSPESKKPTLPSRPSAASSSDAPPRAAVVKPPEAQSPGRKASQAPPERAEALPFFIPAVALTDVEQAMMLAREADKAIPWRTGSHHGFVTLMAVEPGGCRRWRVTRNDLATTFDFVRRC